MSYSKFNNEMTSSQKSLEKIKNDVSMSFENEPYFGGIQIVEWYHSKSHGCQMGGFDITYVHHKKPCKGIYQRLEVRFTKDFGNIEIYQRKTEKNGLYSEQPSIKWEVTNEFSDLCGTLKSIMLYKKN